MVLKTYMFTDVLSGCHPIVASTAYKWRRGPGCRLRKQGAPMDTMTRAEMLTFIAHRDHNHMRRVNRWPAPRWIRLWMICATRGGDGWLWYGMGLIILLFGGSQRLEAVGEAGGAVAVGITLFLRLKRLFNRRRPCSMEPHC